MIFAPWYCFSSLSLSLSQIDKRHYPDLCCKHREFFFLWYLYARKWCTQSDAPFANKIYICDSGSKIPLEPVLEELGLSYQVLAPDDYELDTSKDVYLKKYPTELIHFYGSSRAHIDYLKCCRRHNLDYLLLETDVLAAYDIPADYTNTDFYTQKIRDNGMDTIYQGAICFVDKALVQRAFDDGDMNSYIEGNIDDKDFHEGQMYRLFCRGRTKEMDANRTLDGWGQDPARPYVHKTTPDLLLRFLRENPIDSPYYDRYVAHLVDTASQSA